MPAKGRSNASSAKPGAQQKITKGLRIICRDRHPKLESLVGPQAVGDSVVSKKHRELGEAIIGIQDRVRLGAVLTT